MVKVFVALAITILAVAGYKIIIRAKKMRWDDGREKKNIGIRAKTGLK